jgi:cytochrome c-type biogenesis protein CcmH
MMLWLLIGLVTVAALLWLVRPLVGPQGGGEVRSAYDRRIYADQLREVERDLARGLLSPGETEASRAEIARRLLAADAAAGREAGPVRAPAGASRALALLLAVAAGGGAVALYLHAGAPALPDQPLARRTDIRPSQAEAERMLREAGVPAAPAPAGPEEQEYAALVEKLAAAVRARPDDLYGHRLLAGALARLGRFAEAHPVQARAIALAGAAVTADDRVALAEYMILAANGYVSPEAEDALALALEQAPGNRPGRFYAGLAMAQNGRPDGAYALWTKLLGEGPPDAPWIGAIRAELPRVAAAIGAPLPEDAAAAPGVEGDAIRGMVEGLAARLAAEGGPPGDWAKLIRSLGVLGETARARAIWAEAQAKFGDRPEALAPIREAAVAAGLTE